LEDLKEWIAYIYMGLFVGTLGFLGYVGVAVLLEFVMKWTHHFIDQSDENGNEVHGVFLPFVVFVGISTLYGFLGCFMTAYYAQGASMSGLPEIIAITNGINYPEYFGKNILLTKMVGNTLAVSAKMCVGKEGPLAHSGANVGILTMYTVPFLDLRFL
jgi:H+/Cl- antiporter ClcA